jgi:GAF domain-containing protein
MNQIQSAATSAPSPGNVAIVLKRLARSCVPSLADFCFIHVAEQDLLRCAAAAHATREGQRVVGELARIHRIVRSDPVSTVAEVVRSGRPQLRREIALDPDPPLPRRVAQAHRQLAPRSAIVVPFRTRAGVLGALTLGYAASSRRYGAHDMTVAARLASRIASYLSHPELPFSRTRPPDRSATAPIRRLPPLRARV